MLKSFLITLGVFIIAGSGIMVIKMIPEDIMKDIVIGAVCFYLFGAVWCMIYENLNSTLQ